MKVGTDGVLLGAWADVRDAKSILDIGTGSGIIALVMAQRSRQDAKIDAVELLEGDAGQALENVLSSPWPDKISVVNTSIQKFDPAGKYDLIVCNPPFFSKSLLPPGQNRTSARHDLHLSHDDLIKSAGRLLSPSGKLCIILPPGEGDLFIRNAASEKIFIQLLTRFFTRAGKPQERSIMQFGFASVPLVENHLTLYRHDDKWTTEYKKLTEAFYLDKTA